MSELIAVSELLVSGTLMGLAQHLYKADSATALCGSKNYLNSPKAANPELAIIWCKSCAKKVAA